MQAAIQAIGRAAHQSAIASGLCEMRRRKDAELRRISVNTDGVSTKSQTQMIIDKLMQYLAEHSEFNSEVLTRLKNLAADGHLSKHEELELAISASSGGGHEDN